jgi:hypothetical protein
LDGGFVRENLRICPEHYLNIYSNHGMSLFAFAVDSALLHIRVGAFLVFGADTRSAVR